MIKIVFVIRRREDMPPDEFHRYWLEEHGPLARSLLEPLGARKYAQSHVAAPELNADLRASRGTGEAYDGLAEVWWDSLEGLATAFTSEQGQEASQALLEDEEKFIDFARSSFFLTEEHVILG